jgi:uncharacterized protein YdiU (UPF0061 family)
MPATNPFFALPYEAALATLNEEVGDRVQPASFSQLQLRFRNDDLLPRLGLSPAAVSDEHFVSAFGKFQSLPLQHGLALRYHGHQFGQYNPYLGDGRGFLYGQVRTVDHTLVDLGTKGSGPTPHAQGRDGRLSLLGGMREVLAAEALQGLGIATSRVLSLIETGESICREDEPSPARAAVMVRLSQTHLRFGTFERLEYYDRPDLIRQLLDHVIQHYYPHLWTAVDRDEQFYAELVQRTAHLVAQWMAAGFCHGALNTDNMSITGEGFDYGPYAFIETYSPYFTAASFDRWGRYSYRNQPNACRWNLQTLQKPLSLVMSKAAMEAVLDTFTTHYDRAYRQAMLRKLGFESLPDPEADTLISLTLQFLFSTQVNYAAFFQALRQQFSPTWQTHANMPLSDLSGLCAPDQAIALQAWRQVYYQCLQHQSPQELAAIAQRLQRHNPLAVLSASVMSEVWEAISITDNWSPFYTLVHALNA